MGLVTTDIWTLREVDAAEDVVDVAGDVVVAVAEMEAVMAEMLLLGMTRPSKVADSEAGSAAALSPTILESHLMMIRNFRVFR